MISKSQDADMVKNRTFALKKKTGLNNAKTLIYKLSPTAQIERERILPVGSGKRGGR